MKVKMYGSDLKKATSFVYLGSTITADGQLDEEINQRIGKAGRAFWALRSIWDSKRISFQNKMIFYRSCVLPALMYGAETWSTKIVNGNKLDVFNGQCL